jgi:hypothetical protein
MERGGGLRKVVHRLFGSPKVGNVLKKGGGGGSQEAERPGMVGERGVRGWSQVVDGMKVGGEEKRKGLAAARRGTPVDPWGAEQAP